MSCLASATAGTAAVVVAHHVDDAGLLGGGVHALGVGDGVGQRLLAQDRLAGLGGRDRDRRVRIAGRADVDDVDVLARQHLLPAGGVLLEPEAGARPP